MEMLGPKSKKQWFRNPAINELNKFGFQINIPDSAVFNKGKLKWIVMNNKEGRVLVNYKTKDISLHRVRLWFLNAVRKRCKEGERGKGSEDRLFLKNFKEKEEKWAVVGPADADIHVDNFLVFDDKGSLNSSVKKIRPKTAKSGSVPRYMQNIHEENLKEVPTMLKPFR